jgi:hypothetical protein
LLYFSIDQLLVKLRRELYSLAISFVYTLRIALLFIRH